MSPVRPPKRAGALWLVVFVEGHISDHLPAFPGASFQVRCLSIDGKDRRLSARTSCPEKTEKSAWSASVRSLEATRAALRQPAPARRDDARRESSGAGVTVPRAFDTWTRLQCAFAGQSNLSYSSSRMRVVIDRRDAKPRPCSRRRFVAMARCWRDVRPGRRRSRRPTWTFRRPHACGFAQRRVVSPIGMLPPAFSRIPFLWLPGPPGARRNIVDDNYRTLVGCDPELMVSAESEAAPLRTPGAVDLSELLRYGRRDPRPEFTDLPSRRCRPNSLPLMRAIGFGSGRYVMFHVLPPFRTPCFHSTVAGDRGGCRVRPPTGDGARFLAASGPSMFLTSGVRSRAARRRNSFPVTFPVCRLSCTRPAPEVRGRA